ncbi:hypothetical protein AHF37_02058, partial [Paragonimus kellicotti]
LRVTTVSGVTCDGCRQKEFRLRRYKCLICRDYDLCGSCFDTQQATNKHSSSHPMQCLIPKADHNLFYLGETPSDYSVYSFTCPLCGQLGFTEESFSRHVFQAHPGQESGDAEVICPLCATHAEGDQNRQTRHMARHLIATHQLSSSSNGKNQQTESSTTNNAIGGAESPDETNQSRYSSNRRLFPFPSNRPHRSTDGSRNRGGPTGVRTNRSHHLLDLTTNSNPSYCDTVLDLLGVASRLPGRSMQNSSSSSWVNDDARVMSVTVCNEADGTRSNALGGRNTHNEDSGPVILPYSQTASQRSQPVVDAGQSVTESLTSIRRDALGQRPASDQPAAWSEPSARGNLLDVVPSEHSDAVPVTLQLSQPTNLTVQSVTPAPAQTLPSQKSSSGDPVLSADEKENASKIKPKERSPIHSVQSTADENWTVRDEFDGNWATFLSELVWSSLYFPQGQQSSG